MKKKIKVFDFFSGCGGTSQGFKQAGMDIVFGVDINKDAGKTFEINFPKSYFLNIDIRDLPVSDILGFINGNSHKDDYILFSGCAPCQPFSSQNKNKKDDDPRIDLLSEFSRFVRGVLPDFVFVENVPGIQKVSKKSRPFLGFIDTLEELGYCYEYKILPALWFGVPQKRERLVLVASKHGSVRLPLATHDGKINPYSTVRDWIYDLPDVDAGSVHPNIDDHETAKLSSLNIERIKATPEGGGREHWPERLLLECHKHHTGHTDVYGRLSWDKPASSLTTKCISYSNGRFGHPAQNRALSVREAACLQTFPRDYKFFGSLQSKARQIGNAVPPLMAEVIGREIVEIFLKSCIR
ncbi:DNA cytosine methyltransferase [Erwinia oleae]|uniref:DNA cytosine methyltransferase n=1 Tax=Erwinia oleae TaxID=796334 RepID=UPI000556F2B3|nr:DNA cytosine methyltransferase [Erwinia oleae]